MKNIQKEKGMGIDRQGRPGRVDQLELDDFVKAITVRMKHTPEMVLARKGLPLQMQKNFYGNVMKDIRGHQHSIDVSHALMLKDVWTMEVFQAYRSAGFKTLSDWLGKTMILEPHLALSDIIERERY